MKVATFNVNGIRARLDSISELMQMEAPDVLCLQEIKCENDLFHTIFSRIISAMLMDKRLTTAYLFVPARKASCGVLEG